MKTLFVDLKYTNATFLKSTLDSVQSKNIIITVVVVVVTLVISGTIIGVILFLRTADKRRKATEKVANNSSSSLSSDFGFTAQNPNHTILSIDTLSSVSASGEGQDLIKKKEVSFQDSYEYHQRKQTASFTTGSDKPSKSSLRVNPQHFSPHLVPQVPESQQTREPVPPSQLDTLELQYQASSQLSTLKLQQLMLQSRAKQWVEQQQTFGTTRTTSQHDDHHSEGSAETIASDSGRGCSEEDDVFSTPSADDPKLFEISSPESQRSKDCTTGQRQNRPLEAPGYTALCFKEPWTRKPHLKSHLAPISHSQISLNRNLNVRHSVQSDSTYSIYKDSNNGFSWGSCLHGQDFTGDSALHSFFDKTPVNYTNAYRDDDDMCSTTTSGSYTINPEIDFL
ncbi:hypothetical protein DPMN_108690 [Dreissena polymorpha]|nr:hypothetical protein DPMN_108690 [Dreissena polymorpha]